MAVSWDCWVQVVPLRTKTYAEPWLVLAPTSSLYAPTMAVSPEIATEMPKLSPAAPPVAVSWDCWVQVVPLRTKTYAEPCAAFAPTVSLYAPTMAVSPEMATEKPNTSPAAPSEARACRSGPIHLAPIREKTHAEPWLLLAPTSSEDAPTMAVSPERATELPNTSLGAPPVAVSWDCWVQVVPLRTKTYAEPWSVLAPTSSPYAPTMAVSPERATE